MTKITEFLDKASSAYYAGNPIISDAQFDALADSIGYNKVGAKQHDNVNKHVFQMYSLEKHYEDEGKKSPLAWYTKDKCASIKLDGASVEHLYIDGKYLRSTTRGDGIEGKDVTDKFANTNLIPKEIPFLGMRQITGELVAPKHIENARNYAAGALNLGSVEEFKTRAVEFFAYGIQPNIGPWYDVDMTYLSKAGFNTVFDKNIDKIYPSDGIVHRINNNDDFNAAGYTAKHPKGAYALKERTEAVETKLLDVVWQTGRSGKITPVAILEPVIIEDAKVSRATLNNPEFIRALDLYIGCTVGVRRAGAVIPEIVYKVG